MFEEGVGSEERGAEGMGYAVFVPSLQGVQLDEGEEGLWWTHY